MLPLEDGRRIVSIEYNPTELVPEIARNLLTKGFSLENIADITGLTAAVIENLK